MYVPAHHARAVPPGSFSLSLDRSLSRLFIAVSKPASAKLPKHSDLLPGFDERPHRQIEIVARV